MHKVFEAIFVLIGLILLECFGNLFKNRFILFLLNISLDNLEYEIGYIPVLILQVTAGFPERAVSDCPLEEFSEIIRVERTFFGEDLSLLEGSDAPLLSTCPLGWLWMEGWLRKIMKLITKTVKSFFISTRAGSTVLLTK